MLGCRGNSYHVQWLLLVNPTGITGESCSIQEHSVLQYGNSNRKVTLERLAELDRGPEG